MCIYSRMKVRVHKGNTVAGRALLVVLSVIKKKTKSSCGGLACCLLSLLNGLVLQKNQKQRKIWSRQRKL